MMLWKSIIRQNRNLRHLDKILRNITTAQPKESLNRAKSWQVHSYGEELQCCELRIPIIHQPTEILVQIEAASVNPLDVLMKDGYGKTLLKLFKCQQETLPITLGRDFSGRIIDVGHGVDRKYNIGDKVYGVIPFHKDGSHAEVALVDQSYICHVPEGLLTHTEAASLPYAAITAWSALWVFGGLALQNVKGKRVLILGASGGVGTCAVQILKAYKACVFVTCASDAVPLLQRINADGIFDYTTSDFAENVASEKYDIILDCAKFGHDRIPASWRYGSYVTLSSPLLKNTDNLGVVGGLAASAAAILPSSVNALAKGHRITWAYALPSNQGMRFIDKLVRQSELLPTVDSVFPFDQMTKAYEKTKAGHLRGKVVVDMLSTSESSK